MPVKIKDTEYNYLVWTVLEYNCSVWSPLKKMNWAKLEKLQRKTAHFATGKYRNTNNFLRDNKN